MSELIPTTPAAGLSVDVSAAVNPQVVAVLYPGEMGTRLARLLLEQGHRVITTLAGRSTRTARRCREAGIEVLDGLADVAGACDVVLSIVPPAAALPLGRLVVFDLAAAGNPAIFVDANATSPMTARTLADECRKVDIRFVDASIHGAANALPDSGKLYASGAAAREAAALFAPVMNVEVLGEKPGAASALKMLIGGLNKGVVALAAELSFLASRLGLSDKIWEVYEHSYPGVSDIVRRLLPTYAEHALRRRDEMQELEDTMHWKGLEAEVIHGVRERIADLALTPGGCPSCPENGVTREIVEELYQRFAPGDPASQQTESAGAPVATEVAADSINHVSSL